MHAYSARYVDGKLLYEGTFYDHGHHVLIETRNSPAVQYVLIYFAVLFCLIILLLFCCFCKHIWQQ